MTHTVLPNPSFLIMFQNSGQKRMLILPLYPNVPSTSGRP